MNKARKRTKVARVRTRPGSFSSTAGGPQARTRSKIPYYAENTPNGVKDRAGRCKEGGLYLFRKRTVLKKKPIKAALVAGRDPKSVEKDLSNLGETADEREKRE